VLPLIANEPLGVRALSYAGALTIGIAADRDAYPDLGVLAAAVQDELQGLGAPTYPAFGGPAEGARALTIASPRPRKSAPRPAPVTQSATAT